MGKANILAALFDLNRISPQKKPLNSIWVDIEFSDEITNLKKPIVDRISETQLLIEKWRE